jgi:hypothetical protein
MPRFLSSAIAAAVAACAAAPCLAQSAAREATDLYIRRLAGLPPGTAKGQIQIIDVGHDPMSTMLSIVGNRTDQGWRVSYACASSPQCARGSDHAAKTYTLTPSATAEVDQLLATLKSGAESGGQPPSPGMIGGHLAVRIDYQGFKREYRRTIMWGKTLARLEALMSEPATGN